MTTTSSPSHSAKSTRIRIYDQYRSANPHVVNEVVASDLCVRCGACEPACPFDIVRFGKDGYPFITDEQECRVNCVRCLKVCPGNEIDFSRLDSEMFGQHPHPDSITGFVNGSFVAYSTNNIVREDGASGGLVTALLAYMLEHDVIDGALVLGTEANGDGWQQKPFIARSVEQLCKAAKSKYLVVPMLQPLAEMEQIEGRYAVVALPCYAHALMKYLKVSPKLRKRLKFVIGLYCNVALEPHAVDDLCEIKGVERKDLTDLQFRAGKWPGAVQASVKNSPLFKVLKNEEMKDEFNTLKLFYTPKRCNMCVDFSAEYTDIAVGDPWLRGPDGKYLYPDGYTTLLTRTDIGKQMIVAAEQAGYIKTEPLPLSTFMANFEKSARYKRELVPEFMELLRRRGKPVPAYHRQIGERDLTRVPLWKLRRAMKAAVLHKIAEYKWLRKFLLRLLQTPPAILYLRWNRGRKARNFAANYLKGKQLAERLQRGSTPSADPARRDREIAMPKAEAR